MPVPILAVAGPAGVPVAIGSAAIDGKKCERLITPHLRHRFGCCGPGMEHLLSVPILGGASTVISGCGQPDSFEWWRRYSACASARYDPNTRYEDDSLISWLACFAAFFASTLLSEVGLRA